VGAKGIDVSDILSIKEMLTIIKRDVGEIKPEVKETAKTVVELATRQKVSEKRIGSLESTTAELDRKTAALSQPRPHDCHNEKAIVDLQEDSKENAIGVAKVKKDASIANAEINELKNGHSKFIYWLMGAAMIVAGSIVAWYASYKVTTNEVRHLTTEQAKIRTNLEQIQKTTKALPTKLNHATERVEAAADKIKATNGDHVTLNHVWCFLSKREQVILEQKLPSDKIPKVRCVR